MNKVDLMVRSLLNTYPTLYQDRLDALRTFFTSGNYHWNDQGCIENRYETDRDPNIMNFSDLDEDDAQLAAEEPCEVLADLHAHRLYEAKKARMERELRAENIDLISRTSVSSGQQISYERLQTMNFSSEYMSSYYLGGAPFDKIDPDWLAAAEEFIATVKVSYNRIFSLHYDNPLKGEKAAEPSMFSRMPIGFQRTYTEVCEIEDKLDGQSGKRGRMRKFLDGNFLKNLMEEIKAEDEKPITSSQEAIDLAFAMEDSGELDEMLDAMNDVEAARRDGKKTLIELAEERTRGMSGPC